jgi:hypothetical protein
MTFIGITACTLGESLKDSLHQRLRQCRYLHGPAPIPSGGNVFACRAGVTPSETQRLFTAHGNLICVNVGAAAGGGGFSRSFANSY